MEKNKVYLSLGGNIGDRKGYIQKAIKMIGKINGIKILGKINGIKILGKSGLYDMKLLQLDI